MHYQAWKAFIGPVYGVKQIICHVKNPFVSFICILLLSHLVHKNRTDLLFLKVFTSPNISNTEVTKLVWPKRVKMSAYCLLVLICLFLCGEVRWLPLQANVPTVQIHKNYLFIFFVVVASELYSQVLFHALVPKLQSQWYIFTELLFLFSGFHLIFPPLLLHFFFLVFLQYFPFLFPCSFLSLYSSALFFPAQNWLSFFCRTCSSSLSCSSWRLFSSHSFCFLFAICIYFPLYCVPIAIMLSFPHPCS